MLHDVRSGCELRHVTRFDLGHPGRPLHPRVFIVRRLILILVKHHLVKLGVRRQCRNIVLVGGVQVVKVATQVLLLSALRTKDRRVQALIFLANVVVEQERLPGGREVLVLLHKVVLSAVRRTQLFLV